MPKPGALSSAIGFGFDSQLVQGGLPRLARFPQRRRRWRWNRPPSPLHSFFLVVGGVFIKVWGHFCPSFARAHEYNIVVVGLSAEAVKAAGDWEEAGRWIGRMRMKAAKAGRRAEKGGSAFVL